MFSPPIPHHLSMHSTLYSLLLKKSKAHTHTKKKKYKWNSNKGKTNKTKRRQSKTRQKDYKSLVQFILGWPTTPGHSACPEEWLIYTLRLCWRKLIMPLPVRKYLVTPIAFVPLWYQYNLQVSVGREDCSGRDDNYLPSLAACRVLCNAINARQ